MARRTWIWITGCALIAFAAVSGCGKQEARQPAENQKQPAAVPVQVERIKPGDVVQSLDYVGNIKAQQEVFVFPRVSGKISEKVKGEGAPVKKNEVIAYIDRDEIGLTFEKAPVESQISGIVGRIFVDIGTSVNPQTQVALIVDMERMKINLEIPEKHLPLVCEGQKALINVDAYPGETFNGTVATVSPVLDLTTRTAPVEIRIDNQDHRLKSGMFAKAKLIIKEYKGVPMLLKEAIMGSSPDFYVYVVRENKAIAQKVSLGFRQGPYVQVTEGIKEGDLVVIMGQQNLRAGAAVTYSIE